MSALKQWPGDSTLWYACLRGLDPVAAQDQQYLDQEHNYLVCAFALGREPGGEPTLNYAVTMANRKATKPDVVLVVRSVTSKPAPLYALWPRLNEIANAMGIHPEHRFLVGPGGQRHCVVAGEEPLPDAHVLESMSVNPRALAENVRAEQAAAERSWFERAKLRWPDNDEMADCMNALYAAFGYTIMMSWYRNPGKARWRP